MFRNQYDQDCVTWSPQGRIHQIEYAMEAVKQGSAVVGLKSKTHVVLASVKRSGSDLAGYQQKLFKVDEHLGIAISGLVADGRSICRYMRNECLNHKYVYEAPLPTAKLVRRVADRAQVCTQRSWSRPYGVGLLVGGHDGAGPRLFYNCPSGAFYEYLATAVGARSQAAKTYLERKFESFEGCGVEALVEHALQALRASLTEEELSKENCAVAVVGKGRPFSLLSPGDLAAALGRLDQGDGPPPGDEGGAAPMQTDGEPAGAADGQADGAADGIAEGAADGAPAGAAAGPPGGPAAQEAAEKERQDPGASGAGAGAGSAGS